MSINELLAKVNRYPKLVSERSACVVGLLPNSKSVNTDKDFEELLEQYATVKSWLETHECQTGTDNKLDINDRPYDHDMYCSKLKELEDIVVEIFSRPLEDGLKTQIEKYGL